MLTLVAAIALAIVSLRYASLLWQGLIGILATLVIMVLLMAAIFDRGPRQAFAIGFCIVALGYGLLLLEFGGYSGQESIFDSQWPTTLVLVEARQLFDHTVYVDAVTGAPVPADAKVEMAADGSNRVQGRPISLVEQPTPERFVTTGQFWCAMLFG